MLRLMKKGQRGQSAPSALEFVRTVDWSRILKSHPNFGLPNNSLTDPLFGHSTQTRASSLGSGGATRLEKSYTPTVGRVR